MASRANAGKAMKAPSAPTMNQTATLRCGAVNTTSAASSIPTPVIARRSRKRGEVSSLADSPRIRVAAGTARARASGHSAKSSATSRPNSPAISSGCR